MKDKKINLSVLIACTVASVALLVVLFLPISCPKGVKANNLKGESVDTVIVTDSSGSMDDPTNAGEGANMTKYQAAKKASLEIVSMIEQEGKSLNAKNEIGYIEFSGSVDQSFELTNSTSKIKDYLSGDSSRFPWGTNLGDGVDKAEGMLKKGKNKN